MKLKIFSKHYFKLFFSLALLSVALSFLLGSQAFAGGLPAPPHSSDLKWQYVKGTGGQTIELTVTFYAGNQETLNFLSSEGVNQTDWIQSGQCVSGSSCYKIYTFLTNGQQPPPTSCGASRGPCNLVTAFELSGTNLAPNLDFAIGSNTPQYSVDVAGGSTSSGSPDWRNANGQVVSASNEGQDLEFISPQIIFDASTHAYYISDGSGEYADSTRFLDDGDTLFWPSTGVLKGSSTCLGGLNMTTSGNGNGVYVKVSLVPTQYIAGQNACFFGTSKDPQGPYAVSSVANTASSDDQPFSALGIPIGGSQNIGTHLHDGLDSSAIDLNNVIEGDPPSSFPTVISSHPADEEFAMFYWSDSSTLNVLGSGTSLQAESTSDASGILSKIGAPSTDKIFTTTQCKGGSNVYYPFLLVNYSTSSADDVDFSSPNATAQFYTPNSHDNGWTASWANNQVGCLFGGSAPAANYSVERSNYAFDPGNGDSDTTPLAYISQSTATKPLQTTTTGTGSGQSGGSGSSPSDSSGVCQPGGINLSWFLCPIINSIADFENDVEAIISHLLATTPVEFDNHNCNQTVGNCVFKAWTNMRTVADVILIIGLLVAILIEAAGGGVAEAYTVKRMLPRILVAAILINISVYLVAGMEDIANILGQGVFELIHSAFGSKVRWNLQPNGWSANLVTLGAAGSLVLVSGEALAFFALFVLLPAFFAFVAVFFTIILRQGILLLLLIVSPIAFALYCLPNTEQYFKKWWDLLFKTLMVYPIMMSLFALGDVAYIVMSYLTRSNNNGLGNIGTAADVPKLIAGILPIVALIAPLFLMPFAFKFAGGIIGEIHGALSGIGKKATEAIKGNPNDPNSLRNRTKRNLAIKNTSKGLTWSQIGTAVNPRRLTPEGNRRARSRLALQKKVGHSILRENLEKTALWQEVSKDSNIMKELAEYDTGRDARRALNADVATGKVVRGSEAYNRRSAAIAGAERVGYNPASREAALMNSNYVKFETDTGQQGWDNAMRRIDALSHGDPFAFRSMQDEFQAVAKGAGQRTDLAANTGGDRSYNLDTATGPGSLYTQLNGHPKGTRGLIDEHLKRLADPTASDEQRRLSAQFLTEMKNASSKNQGTAANRDEINKRMADIDREHKKYVRTQAINEYNNLPAGQDVTTTESVEITSPVTSPGVAAGTTETRRVQRKRSLGPKAFGPPSPEHMEEMERRVRNDLEAESRSYTPPDPNNQQT